MFSNVIFNELNLTITDLVAVMLFALGWTAYVQFADWNAIRVPSLHSSMDRFRREWMVRMVERDNRMVDVNVLRSTTRSSQLPRKARTQSATPPTSTALPASPLMRDRISITVCVRTISRWRRWHGFFIPG